MVGAEKGFLMGVSFGNFEILAGVELPGGVPVVGFSSTWLVLVVVPSGEVQTVVCSFLSVIASGVFGFVVGVVYTAERFLGCCSPVVLRVVVFVRSVC